jgi:hypothetical protein
MEVGASDGSLRAGDPEHFAKRLKNGRFAGRVGTDDAGEVAGDVDRMRLRSETAESADPNRLDTHISSLPVLAPARSHRRLRVGERLLLLVSLKYFHVAS